MQKELSNQERNRKMLKNKNYFTMVILLIVIALVYFATIVKLSQL